MGRKKSTKKAKQRVPAAQSQGTGLSDMPVEILRQITQILGKRDLKSLRLMDSRLNAVISDFLFRSIVVESNKSSLRQLKGIASSTKWSSQVQHVSWKLPIKAGRTENTRFGPASKHMKTLSNVCYVTVLNSTISLRSAMRPSQIDVYDFLRGANLKYKRVSCDGIEIQLGYSEAHGHLTSATLCGMVRQPTPTIEDDVEDQWSEAYDGSEDEFDSTEPFESVVKYEAATLRSIALTSVTTGPGFLAPLLSDCLQLTEMTFKDVTLMCSMAYLFGHLRSRIQKAQSSLAVTLTEIHEYCFTGSFSADPAEFQSWADGNVDARNFVQEVEATFSLDPVLGRW